MSIRFFAKNDMPYKTSISHLLQATREIAELREQLIKNLQTARKQLTEYQSAAVICQLKIHQYFLRNRNLITLIQETPELQTEESIAVLEELERKCQKAVKEKEQAEYLAAQFKEHIEIFKKDLRDLARIRPEDMAQPTPEPKEPWHGVMLG